MTATVEIMPPGADIFASGCEALVNPVNCVGVSGKGLALEFKRRFPVAVRAYELACKARKSREEAKMRPGDVMVHAAKWPQLPGDPRRFVFFAATKDHWRNPSKIEWVAEAIAQIEIFRGAAAVASIAIPALGCGLGGLPWADVEPLILASAARMAANGCAVKVYPPR